MCGISGAWRRAADLSADELRLRGERMSAALRHRGPDDGGVWCDPAAGLLLAHRRLSILDLSPAGHQPMLSPSGNWVLIFNGEIYNHAALRGQLESRGCVFRGHSDTEVLLAAIENWGVDATCRRATGMFAFAAWERSSRTLWLARDRMGEKPLYYGWAESASAGPDSAGGERSCSGANGTLLFASELKAIDRWPGFRGQVDPRSLGWLLHDGYVRGPQCVYRGFHKLPPGTWLRIRAEETTFEEPVPYWSLIEVAAHGLAHPFPGTNADAIDQLQQLIDRAVQQQQVADVPVGAFLSGGIDSSAIVSAMQRTGTQAARTFTIRFGETEYNEADHALAVAKHLGTVHTEFEVTAQDALDLIPKLPDLYDEPFADASQIPTCLVSRLARQQVTVCLSGDGGDELFGGYARYRELEKWWRRFGGVLPRPIRQSLARMIDLLAGRAGVKSTHGNGVNRLQRRMRSLGDLLRQPDVSGFYFWFHALWREPALLLRDQTARDLWRPEFIPPQGLSILQTAMLADGLAYLPDDILAKVDRAGMAVSLESRIPLLDPSVVEFAWSLPDRFRYRDGESKWILKQVLERSVPRSLFDRPKMGFGVPLDHWLRGPLRDWAEALLTRQALEQNGLCAEPIQAVWQAHLRGTSAGQYLLWPVLMWQAWCERRQNPAPYSA